MALLKIERAEQQDCAQATQSNWQRNDEKRAFSIEDISKGEQ